MLKEMDAAVMSNTGEEEMEGLGEETQEASYLKQKAAEAEKEKNARRKEDMRFQHLMEMLQNEQRVSAANLHKLTDRWRSIFRQAKVAELRSEISLSSETFEWVLECKDNINKSLMLDLNEAEQQAAMAQRTYHQCLDRLLELQKDQVAELALQWDHKSLDDLSAKYNAERDKITMRHLQACNYLEDVAFAQDLQNTEQNNKAAQDYRIARMEIKQQHSVEMHVTHLQQRDAIKGLLQQFRKEQKSDKDIPVHFPCSNRVLQKTQDSIDALRAQLRTSQNESEVLDLQKDREEVTDKTRQLRIKTNMAQAAERRKLVNLTAHSHNTTKKLQDVIGKGEKLLRLAEMCRKFETEQEKVPSFFGWSLSAEELAQEKACATMEAPSEDLPAQAMLDDNKALENVWQRYNKVQLEHLYLKKKKADLDQENQQLKQKIQQKLKNSGEIDQSIKITKLSN